MSVSFALIPVNRKDATGCKVIFRVLKESCIDLLKANIALKMKEQPKMSERDLSNILTYAKEHPKDPLQSRRRMQHFYAR